MILSTQVILTWPRGAAGGAPVGLGDQVVAHLARLLHAQAQHLLQVARVALQRRAEAPLPPQRLLQVHPAQRPVSCEMTAGQELRICRALPSCCMPKTLQNSASSRRPLLVTAALEHWRPRNGLMSVLWQSPA